MPHTLRLILGDQLHLGHSWFQTQNPDILYVLMEVRQETDYVAHHIQKIVGFFAAMRHFANALQQQGHHVEYWTLDHPHNQHNFETNLRQLLETHRVERFEYQNPDEYRVDQQLRSFCQTLSIPSSSVDTEHFLSERLELQTFFAGKKTYRMENFYRYMRRKHNIMMDGKKPLTGRWNYDAENRKKLPKKQTPPLPLVFSHDVTEIVALLQSQQVKTIGTIDPKQFLWPISREECLQLLTFFLQQCLPLFGTYQDAMTPDEWSLYHSRLSFGMNTKLLTPMEVVQAAIEHWQQNQHTITIAQIEGFVRQIIGWREYMRGVYWAHMPDYAQLNYFEHTRPLPSYYWTGDTKMHCMRHSIQQSLTYAYAHHIQRLMVTGNFALLAGIHPDQVDQWYLGIYIDALEWVEITNTRGMSQFADGGIVGSKPYVSSANYIDKMSHYCKTCHYQPKTKIGTNACPFNSLYWSFYERHRDKLANNPRIGMMYRVWDRMDLDTQQGLLAQAQTYLQNLDTL